LRAVAREAGVSPAAPYHHFKDKGEMLDAVALEGWDALGVALAEARDKAGPDDIVVRELGVAYVCFARDNPALYRVMYERSRDKDALPDDMRESDESADCLVRETLREVAGDDIS